MRAALLAIPLLLMPLAASAGIVAVNRIDIVARGIFRIEAGAPRPDQGTPTGAVTSVGAATLLKSTTTIPASTGTEFGLQYVVTGIPAGGEVDLDIVNLYPPRGLQQPGRSPMHESRYTVTKKIGDKVYLGYGLENDWEAVPGKWTFQIWFAGKKLAEQSFVLTAPPAPGKTRTR